MKDKSVISIIIPTFNEELYIANTIDSLIAQKTSYKFEIIIVDGMSNDDTRKIIKQKIIDYPQKNIIILDNKRKIVSSGFNIGLSHSKGEIIIRVDGHTKLDKYYIENCVSTIKKIDVECVGGPTKHIGNTFIGNIIRIAQTSTFGTGGASFRKKVKKGKYVDTLAFGAYKRAIFNEIGGYDEELVRNQDDEFNFRLIQNGGKIWIDPKIKSNYYNRNSILGLSKQYFQYGYYKILVMKKRNGIASLRHIIPGIFVSLFLIFLSLTVLDVNRMFFLYFISLYTFVNIFFSIDSIMKESVNLMLSFILFFTYFVMHFSYGMGTILGSFGILFSRGSKKVMDASFDKKMFNRN